MEETADWILVCLHFSTWSVYGNLIFLRILTPKAYGGFYDMLGYWEYDYFSMHKSEKNPVRASKKNGNSR